MPSSLWKEIGTWMLRVKLTAGSNTGIAKLTENFESQTQYSQYSIDMQEPVHTAHITTLLERQVHVRKPEIQKLGKS